MIGNVQFIIVVNLVCVAIVLFFTYRMVKSATIYNWNPGKTDLQHTQKIKILTSIVVIAAVGLFAAMVDILFG